jgi:hypothetical protein
MVPESKVRCISMLTAEDKQCLVILIFIAPGHDLSSKHRWKRLSQKYLVIVKALLTSRNASELDWCE